MEKVERIGIIVAILIVILIASTAITYYSISSRIDSIDNALRLESEDHYMDIRSNIEQSVVLVLSSPAHSNGGASDEIYLDDNNVAHNLGTGFSINARGDILTAYHVVKDAKDVEIIYDTGKDMKILPVIGSMNNPELDIAVLRVDSSIPQLNVQSGEFKDITSKVGSGIGYSGYINAQNKPIKITVRGSVSGSIPFTYNNQSVLAYVLGTTANKGNSGGPVFSLKTGEVIGIINGKVVGIDGITISTPINQNLINSMVSQLP